MTDKLLPCPFCGSRLQWVDGPDNGLRMYLHSENGCAIQGQIFIVDHSNASKARLASWNSRAPSDGKEAVAWRVRHMNDGPHMWEYYPLSVTASPSENMISQHLTVRQLLDVLNDDKHASAQERNPEPHAPSYLMQAFRDAWIMAGEMEGSWEDAYRLWRPPFAVDPSPSPKSVLGSIVGPEALTPCAEPLGENISEIGASEGRKTSDSGLTALFDNLGSARVAEDTGIAFHNGLRTEARAQASPSRREIGDTDKVERQLGIAMVVPSQTNTKPIGYGAINQVMAAKSGYAAAIYIVQEPTNGYVALYDHPSAPPESHTIAAWRYRYEPDLQWHVVEYVDQLPRKEEFPLLQIEALYAEPPASETNMSLPQDVINLVIAAREAFDTGMLPGDENHALDKALKAFSSRVPYENEPDLGHEE